ncbi:MAG: small multi-drug export protein [Candidatus Binatia bacterium]
MLRAVLILGAMTFIPALELRASIPYGLGVYQATLGPAAIVFVCILANFLLAPVVWIFLDKGIHLLLRIEWINSLYERVVPHARERVHAYVERYGTMGLALFIGVPLPGSGVYSGGLGAYLLGFTFGQYMVASAVGVIIAGAAVTAVSLTGLEAFELFLKRFDH